MAERPILMSAPMVRALIEGTKTQTRRVVADRHLAQIDLSRTPCRANWSKPMPYGQPGDRLWVRETWMPDPPCDGTWGYTAWAGSRIGQISAVPERFRKPEFCNYRATWPHKEDGMRWTPGIHMPRWASRITLEVTGVRVERLQDISTSDAEAEGWPGPDAENSISSTYPIAWYSKLWEEINGPGSWTANPWVWCVAFRRLETAC